MLLRLFKRGDYGVAAGGFSGLNNPNVPLYQALAGLASGDYAPVNSGAAVTTTSAMRVITVHRCVTLIAQSIASLPLGVYRYERDRRVELTNPAERFIWGRPNPEMSRVGFWATTIGMAVLTGNAYIYKVRDGLGRVTEIWPLDPRKVEPVRDRDGTKRFQVGADLLDSDTVLHVPSYGDGFKGLNPIAYAREGIGMALATEEFGARFFGQGSTLAGVLTTDGKIDDPTADKLERRWSRLHSGVQRAHRIAILEGGLKYQQVGIAPEDAQFLETRRFQVEEIARLFGVPPHLLGAVDRTTSWGKGIEEQNIGFVTYTLGWWITLFEQAITDDLLAPANHYARWNVNGLLRGNTAERYQSYQIGRNAGFLSINDIRKFEELPPIDGGDDYAQPLNSSSSGASAPATDGGAADDAGTPPGGLPGDGGQA